MEKRNRWSSSPASVLERTGDVLQDDANLCFPTRCTAAVRQALIGLGDRQASAVG